MGGSTRKKNPPSACPCRAVKQLLIKRPYRREALAGELAAFHADGVEAGESSIMAARKAKRDHIAAHAGESAHHHLRPRPLFGIDEIRDRSEIIAWARINDDRFAPSAGLS
jgi:hypothetical protein